MPDPKTLTADDATTHAWRGLLARIDEALRLLAAHPARSVVLLPYQQLLPLARRLWAERFPDGFAPRFETTRTWADAIGSFVSGPSDLSFDHGRDLLVAASLLEGAGRGGERGLLAAPLVEQASELGRIAAGLPPALRADWAAQARSVMPAASDAWLELEGVLGRIAVAWAAGSDYATDVLFEPRVIAALDAVVIVPGLQSDPLVETLAEHWFEKVVQLPLEMDGPRGRIALHACADGEDEAERAAACVLAHLAAGRTPVALVATDRFLTRRISALLATRGVRAGGALRDETGWRLSTTHAAAGVVATLRAVAPAASSDAVLDWIRCAPVFASFDQRTLERKLRREAVRSWHQAARLTEGLPLTAGVEALRAGMAARRSLADWLVALRRLLVSCELWGALAADDAGRSVIDALGLDDGRLADWRDWPAAQRRVGLEEFTHWVQQVLEAASFRPPHAGQAQVVVLPLAQLFGRSFAALVLPGADERNLAAAPEPTGPWSAGQRQKLHLPSREDLQHAQRAAWALALAAPEVDLLWRHTDDGGETLLPSPLVEALRLDAAPACAQGVDVRVVQRVTPAPTPRPRPSGAALPAQPLSASSYEQLRSCPYRFFALRQLGLQEEGELDVDLDKRDWGNWVHLVLRLFHEALQGATASDRLTLIDDAAARATRELGMDAEPGEFLPFRVAWPKLRDAYLEWLKSHEATGAGFETAEQWLQVQRGPLQLHGRIDRIDRAADGGELLIDYKTERLDRTEKRIKVGTEETQLPFYALLSDHESPRAAYLNLAEREAPSLHELENLGQLAAGLQVGMARDMERIAAGAALEALGEGSVCDWCEVRGLCRKDFWSE